MFKFHKLTANISTDSTQIHVNGIWPKVCSKTDIMLSVLAKCYLTTSASFVLVEQIFLRTGSKLNQRCPLIALSWTYFVSFIHDNFEKYFPLAKQPAKGPFTNYITLRGWVGEVRLALYVLHGGGEWRQPRVI